MRPNSSAPPCKVGRTGGPMPGVSAVLSVALRVGHTAYRRCPMCDAASRPVLIVCGSRAWTDWPTMRATLDHLWCAPMLALRAVWHGGAQGADLMATTWAEMFPGRVPVRSWPGGWALRPPAGGERAGGVGGAGAQRGGARAAPAGGGREKKKTKTQTPPPPHTRGGGLLGPGGHARLRGEPVC